MILYLNKNLNENSKNPFKSRFNNYSSNIDMTNNNNNINSGSFGLGNNNMKTLETNSNLNANLNIINLNTFNNNINNENNLEQNFGMHSKTSNKQISSNNYLQNSLSSNASGMIMPETNFTGYKFNEKNYGNKYMNNPNNAGLGLGSGGSLLAHKYGGSVTNSMSLNNNNDNVNENFVMSAKINSDFISNNNLEEEYPRTLAQPQSQIIRK